MRLQINPNRIYGLDILRSLAIIFVVLAHGSSFLPERLQNISWHFQYDGVSIFFVLSGFLIGGILIKLLENKGATAKNLINFWIRRWFRTLPNYFLVLAVLSFLYLNFTNYYSFDQIKYYYIFFQNFCNPHPTFFPEAWSLSIEEWFYLLIPILVFGTIRFFKISVRHSILTVALSIIVVVTLFRWYKFSQIETFNASILDTQFRTQVITRLDSLMYGIVGVYTAYFHQKFWNSHKIFFFIIGIILFAFSKYVFIYFKVSTLYQSVFSFSTIALATLCLLPFLNSLKKGNGIFYFTFTYISLISYSMYLLNLSLHTFITKLSIHFLNGQSSISFNVFQYFCFWILTILASIILYKYFELPVMKLRDHVKLK